MKRYLPFLIFALVFLLGVSLYQGIISRDGKLHVTVCNVGQGDAVYIRTPQGKDILFDGGPDGKVLECLARQMPFWDRSLDLLILSHPHADHYSGFLDVLDVYQVRDFMTGEVTHASSGFAVLQEKIASHHIHWQQLTRGDKLRTADGVSLSVIGPVRSSADYAASGLGGDGLEINAQSLELILSYQNFDLLLTGDSQASQLLDALSQTNLPRIDVLQVPHHGSQTGLTEDIFRFIQPQTATISDGKKNRYGHPSPEILTLLQQHHLTVLRTDKEGDLRLVSDGKTYNVVR